MKHILSPIQFQMLDAIYASHSFCLLPTSVLADRVFKNPRLIAPTGRILFVLEQKGLVRRKGDRNLTVWEITKKGLTAVRAAQSIYRADLFTTLATALRDRFGGHDGFLALGAALAFGMDTASDNPPRLWIEGKLATGKTTAGRCLMDIWSGTPLALMHGGRSTAHDFRNLPARAIRKLLSNYNGIPLWFDNYGCQREPRGGNAMHMAKESELRSCHHIPLLVTGECVSRDAATRSRFVCLKMPDRINSGLHVELPSSPGLGNAIAERRTDFSSLVQKVRANFLALAPSGPGNARVKYIYATAYAGFVAGRAFFGSRIAVGKFGRFTRQRIEERITEF